MASKTIAWTTGGGNITLSYGGQGNGPVSVSSSQNDSFDARSQRIYLSTTLGSPERNIAVTITQKGKSYSPGDVFNFDYTGSVQSIVLPKGKYKLQCWGAQGGTSYGSSSATGSKGGYSEGVLTLTEKKTLYVFVGGKGSRSSSSSQANGGWNGGGAAVGYAYYNYDDEYGESYPACGGGATDIATVTSSMSYSSGRTNRSSASLLSRMIVAGGGAGGSYAYQEVTSVIEEENSEVIYSGYPSFVLDGAYIATIWFKVKAGSYYYVNVSGTYYNYNCSGFTEGEVVSSSGSAVVQVGVQVSQGDGSDVYVEITRYYTEIIDDSYSDSAVSNKSQQGGGTSGKGMYPGKQNTAGQDAGFGYGANQTTTNYRYCSGAGGGGWYGGGRGYSDDSINYVNYSGGGSGFVNTAANASYRPNNYTGLQLDSGTTTAGSSSFESVSGGKETGHSGNGYARITVIE